MRRPSSGALSGFASFSTTFLDLDSRAHVLSWNRQQHMLFFDVAAAFPCLAHSWPFKTLVAYGAPPELLRLLEGIYWMAITYGSLGLEIRILFAVDCGVLQGCPLSGTLSAVALNPFLEVLDSIFQRPGFGIIRACADDLGANRKRISTFRK